MRLVSDHVQEGRRGPTAPQTYPTLPGVDLADITRFTGGQPWADYARMRAEAPVMWHPEPRGAPGFWAVTRYADVARVNNDPKTFSSERGGINMAIAPPERRVGPLFGAALNTLINLDGADHRQLRREHMPFFTATYLRTLREKVAVEVTRLLDGMAADGRGDFVSGFASHLPMFTLCEMLGVPEADREKFIRWTHFLEMAIQIGAEQADTKPEDVTPQLMQFIQLFNATIEEMFAYGREMLHKRRVDPQEDLMSAIARAQLDGDFLSDEYLDGSWLLIVFAGNDTTRNTLSGAMKLLTENPEQKARVLADGALLPNMVHEVTRLVSPVIYMKRIATQDVEVAGQVISEGEKVIMWYGAANRDAAVFPDPDRFDVGRENAEKNLAFGLGPHICLGRLVAQLELEESYRQILARLPDMRWSGDIDIAPNNFVHAIRRLGVEWTPERRAA